MDIDAQREHDAKTGGCIFPVMFDVDGERVCAEGSLTLRDYFAANAPTPAQAMPLEEQCAYRYRYADTMLAARREKQ